jgi:hypothetical protein
MPTQNRPNLYLVWAYAPIFSRKTLGRFVPFFSFPVRSSSFVLARSIAALRRIRQERAEQNEVAEKNLRRKKTAKEQEAFFWINFLERNFGYLVLKYFPAELQ